MNPMNRRGFLGVLGATAAATTLTACAGAGAGGDTSGESGGTASGGDTGTITFWSNHPGDSKSLETDIIAAFESENPGLKVNLSLIHISEPTRPY